MLSNAIAIAHELPQVGPGDEEAEAEHELSKVRPGKEHAGPQGFNDEKGHNCDVSLLPCAPVEA